MLSSLMLPFHPHICLLINLNCPESPHLLLFKVSSALARVLTPACPGAALLYLIPISTCLIYHFLVILLWHFVFCFSFCFKLIF